LSKATAARRALQIFIPAATAIVGVLKGGTPPTTPTGIATGSAVIQMTLLILVALSGMVVVLTDKSATSVVHDAQKALDGREEAEKALTESSLVIEELEAALARAVRIEDIVDAMRAVVDVAICKAEIPSAKLTEWLTDLLDFLVTDKLTLFGIGDEQWNFSIYIFDPETSELRCVVTRRPTKKEEDVPHRSWREGEGHVGKAFQARRPLVCADSTDANVRGFFDAPAGKLMDYDLDRYRSLAAIPIQSDDELPLGVLVATSEIVGRFDPENEETFRPLLSLSRTLATLLSVYNLKPH
jgi:cell division protein FtsL